MAAWYYAVVDRNWRCRDGELDIVAAKGNKMVFCEVKTRSGTGFGAPAEAVGHTKQARIRRLAARWLAENGDRRDRRSWTVRFDVAAVLGGRIDVIEDAF